MLKIDLQIISKILFFNKFTEYSWIDFTMSRTYRPPGIRSYLEGEKCITLWNVDSNPLLLSLWAINIILRSIWNRLKSRFFFYYSNYKFWKSTLKPKHSYSNDCRSIIPHKNRRLFWHVIGKTFFVSFKTNAFVSIVLHFRDAQVFNSWAFTV